jgi:hypothetical protein
LRGNGGDEEDAFGEIHATAAKAALFSTHDIRPAEAGRFHGAASSRVGARVVHHHESVLAASAVLRWQVGFSGFINGYAVTVVTNREAHS